MNFLQIHNYYEPYLSLFYSRQPDLQGKPFSEQIDALIADGFTGCHIIAPYMAQHGLPGQLIVANCPYSQEQWARENSFTGYTHADWQQSIVARQIETLRPDVLYISHPIGYDTRFLNQLSWKPQFVFGWRSADIPADLDVSGFDLMLTSCEPCYRQLQQHGARAVEYHSPGIPDHIWSAVRDTSVETDITFIGQWSAEHQKRAEYLKAIGKSPLGFRGEFSIAYHLLTSDPAALPASVSMYNRGPVFGLDMYRALRKAKIGLNGIIDFAGKEAGNMRMFEVTSVGSLLLTEHDDSITRFFEPGKEVATFTDVNDLIDKLYYYLEHEEERQAIAERGRIRCHSDHSLSEKVKHVYALLEDYFPAIRTNLQTGYQPTPTDCFNGARKATDVTRDALKEFRIAADKQSQRALTAPAEPTQSDLTETSDPALYARSLTLRAIQMHAQGHSRTVQHAQVYFTTEDTDASQNLQPISEHVLYVKPLRECTAQDVDKLIDDALIRLEVHPESSLDCIEIAEHLRIPRKNLELVRGLCYLKLGKPEEAEKAFDRELAEYPDNRQVHAIRSGLQQ